MHATQAATAAAYLAALDEETGYAWSEEGQHASGALSVTFAPGTLLAIRAMIALGADLTADPLTWVWTDISTFVRYDVGVSATTGRADEASRVQPGRGALKLDNRDGRFSRKNPMGPYFGLLTRNTPIWVTVDPGTGTYDVITMFVNEWPARWDSTSTDFYVPVGCGGILRRLQQGTVLKNCLPRFMTGQDPVEYWPMEEGTAATVFTSALNTGFNMSTAGTVSPGVESTLAGSGPLPTPAAASIIFGRLPPFPASYSAESDNWAITWAVKIDAAPAAESTLLHWWSTGGTVLQWFVNITAASKIVVRAYNSALVEVFADTGTTYDQFGNWVIFTAKVTHDISAPPDFRFTLVWETPLASLIVVYATQSGVQGEPAALEHLGFGASIGHIAVWPTDDVPFLPDPAYAFPAELAGDRMIRVCAEEGVRLTIPDSASTCQMGPQPRGTLLDVLRDCESADLGVLYEHGFGLGYQSRAERYNAPVALTVDYSGGQIGDDLEPTDDDQRLRNRWTVTRSAGTTATAQDDASIAAEVIYPDSTTANVYADSQVLHLAQWLVHRDTVDDVRWPAIGLNLANAAGRGLIPAWTALPYGARMTVTNPPYQATSDPVDAFIEGKTERVDQFTWTAQVNTTPAQSYEVFELEGAGNRGRLDLAQSLAADIATDDVSLSVATATADLPLLTTTATFPADFPFDINIGGERMTVTAVVGAASPQTVTVTRSVNSVVKSHVAGTAVSLWNPGGLAL